MHDNMDPNMPPMKKSPVRRSKWICLALAVLTVIVIAIVVPLAIILPKKHKSSNASKSTSSSPDGTSPTGTATPTSSATPMGTALAKVILPLYMYPTTTDTWNPLYDALDAHPQVNFTVVINPSSGPGAGKLPDSRYQAQLKKLNKFPNVESLGYVRTGYGTRTIADVASDINKYAGWSATQGLGMEGIFFDESPYNYSAANVDFMQAANQAVINATGLLGDKKIVHNPGTFIDGALNLTTTDFTIVYDEAFSANKTKLDTLRAMPRNPEKYGLMIHTLPDMNVTSLREYVEMLTPLAENLFISSNDLNFFENFGTQWANFTDAVVSE